MQLQTGNLYVVVSDNSGSPLPGVTLTLLGSGAPQATVTNAEGGARFLNLMPGDYQVKAELEGFAASTKPVVVNLGRNTELGIVLQPAIGDARGSRASPAVPSLEEHGGAFPAS